MPQFMYVTFQFGSKIVLDWLITIVGSYGKPC
jgi:hypothetical protein